MRVVCECGASREMQPQALARLLGWKVTLRQLALLAGRKQGGGGYGRGEPRPRAYRRIRTS